MRELGKKLYDHLHPSAQEALLSGYFFVKRRRVRNATFRACAQDLRQSETADRATLRRLQMHRLQVMLNAALQTPYYGELFRRLGIGPGDFRDPDCLTRLPILTKDVVRRDPDAFVNRAACPNGGIVAYTSGSTGSPLRVTLAPDFESREEAFVARQWAWAGLRDDDRRIRLRGDLVVRATEESASPWRRNVSDHELRMSSYHLSRETARAYVDRINRFRPKALIAYPSSAHLLASFVEAFGLECHIPRIFTSSETLTLAQRETIERHLHGKVFDHYGCTEASVAIQQCEHGTYHVVPEYGVTEFVPVEGSEGGPTYDVVSTGLLNTAMPLLRYQTGDRVRITGDVACACGRAFQTIDAILGRDDDVVVTPRGDHVGRLDHVYKGLVGIIESQIRQEAPDALRVLVVPAASYDDACEAELVANLRSRVGDMEIVVERVAAIPRGPNGKFRGVVSTISR